MTMSSRKRGPFGYLALAAAAALLLQACAGGAAPAAPTSAPKTEAKSQGAATAPAAKTETKAASPAAGGTIKIGVPTVQTGQLSVFGIPQRKAAELAIEEINAAGGINGRRFEPFYEDTGGTVEQGVSVFQKLINRDRVNVTLGDTYAQAAFTEYPIACGEKVPVVALQATPGIAQICDYVWRLVMLDGPVVDHMLSNMAPKLGWKKVAIVCACEDPFIKGSYDGMVASLTKNGIEVLTTENVRVAERDFSAAMTKIVGLKPDAIGVAHFTESGANIMVQGRKLGLPQNVRFFGGRALIAPRLVEIAGPDAEGTLAATPFFGGADNPKTQAFIKAYKARFNEDGDWVSAFHYDAVYFIADALKKVGNDYTDGAKLREAMLSIKSFEGAQGKVTISDTREATGTPYIVEVKDGKFQTVQ
jgi:branched-chain amino acid transport system substrate-binding protein